MAVCPKSHEWYLHQLAQLVKDSKIHNQLFLIYIVEHAEHWSECGECQSEAISGKIPEAEEIFLEHPYQSYTSEHLSLPTQASDLDHPLARLCLALASKSVYQGSLEEEKNPDPAPDQWTLVAQWGKFLEHEGLPN